MTSVVTPDAGHVPRSSVPNCGSLVHALGDVPSTTITIMQQENMYVDYRNSTEKMYAGVILLSTFRKTFKPVGDLR